MCLLGGGEHAGGSAAVAFFFFLSLTFFSLLGLSSRVLKVSASRAHSSRPSSVSMLSLTVHRIGGEENSMAYFSMIFL